MKKLLALLPALLLLAITVNADIMVTDVNVSKDTNGAGYLGSGDTNISFLVRDDNATCTMATTRYDVNIYYSSTKGAHTTTIVADLNLGDVNESSGYCLTSIAAGCSTAPAKCSYVWTSAAIDAIADGNYFIDVNVQARVSDANFPIYDQNMDSNHSFYIDNTTPECVWERRVGNKFAWISDNDDEAVARGSRTTLYYTTDEQTYSSALLSQEFPQTLELSYSSGEHDYYCYAVDSAGNTSATTEKLDLRHPEGVTVAVGGAGAASVSPVAGLAANLPETIAGFPTPIVIIVGIVVVVLISGGGKSKRRRKRKRR